MERMELQRIAKFYTIELEHMEAPTKEDVERVASARVIALLEQKKRDLNGLEKERISNYIQLVEDLTNQEIQSEGIEEKDNLFMLAMLLDELYQKSLNPEPVRQARNAKQNGRRERNPRPRQDEALSSEDSLDSMRDGFQESQRQKYGNRPARGSRNENNRNEAPRRSRSDRPERFGREDRQDRFDRQDRPSHREDSRYERKARPNRGFDPRNDNNDDDIFSSIDSPRRAPRESRNFGDRDFSNRDRNSRDNRSDSRSDSRPSRENRYDSRPSRESRFENASRDRGFNRNADKPFSRNNDSRPSYGAESFPRKRRNENQDDQSDYVVFKDDNFFVLPDSNPRRGRERNSREDSRDSRPRKASTRKTSAGKKNRR